MASVHGNAHSEAAKMEQIITEFFAKSLQIILESRSPYMSSRNYSGEQAVSSPCSSSSSSSSVRPRDKWFNLALRECPAALENIDLWHQSNQDPMVVDVILVQRPVDFDPVSFSPKKTFVKNISLKDRYNTDQDEFRCEMKSEKIIERWVVQYDSRKNRDTCHGSSRRMSNSTLYKKTILLLRSLYVTVRLFPAFKIYHDLNSSSHIRPFTLTHRVSSFVEPFTRREEKEMQKFVFTPVDTSCGRLCLTVLYHSSVLDISSEPSTPLSPQVITDYVGSPLADPLKRFPSLPATASASHGFTRRHSWSFDINRASPPFPSFFPSPTHSEPQTSNSNPSSHGFPPSSLPPLPPETYLIHKKDPNCDEYFPSPSFSPSPSPSASPTPPIRIPGSHLSNALLRSESAPVRIPTPKLANSPAFKQTLPPSPPLKTSKSSTSRSHKSVGVTHPGTPNEKFSLMKEETRQSSGLKLSSNSSPRVSFSRSSSRSFPDDFDESDFTCAFDVDVDDITDPGSRPESFEQKLPFCDPLEPGGGPHATRKSTGAAVGALVLMLRKAPPLRQDFSKSVANSSEVPRPETWGGNIILESNQAAGLGPVQHVASSSVMASGLVASKTTADALEELQGYRDLKNFLLSQGSKSHT